MRLVDAIEDDPTAVQGAEIKGELIFEVAWTRTCESCKAISSEGHTNVMTSRGREETGCTLVYKITCNEAIGLFRFCPF